MKKKSLFLILLLLVSCESEKIYKKYSFFVAGHTYGEPRIDNVGFHPPFKDKFEIINEDELISFGVLTLNLLKKSNNQV